MNYLGAMGELRDVPIRVSEGSEGQIANLGDYQRLYDSTISNLADPSVVQDIVSGARSL